MEELSVLDDITMPEAAKWKKWLAVSVVVILILLFVFISALLLYFFIVLRYDRVYENKTAVNIIIGCCIFSVLLLLGLFIRRTFGWIVSLILFETFPFIIITKAVVAGMPRKDAMPGLFGMMAVCCVAIYLLNTKILKRFYRFNPQEMLMKQNVVALSISISVSALNFLSIKSLI